MHEILSFTVFGQNITIYTYGTMIVLAFLLGAWWAQAARRRGARHRPGALVQRRVRAAVPRPRRRAPRLLAFAHYGEFTQPPDDVPRDLGGRPRQLRRRRRRGLLWLCVVAAQARRAQGLRLLDLLVTGGLPRASRSAGSRRSWRATTTADRPTLPWGIPVACVRGRHARRDVGHRPRRARAPPPDAGLRVASWRSALFFLVGALREAGPGDGARHGRVPDALRGRARPARL